MLRHLAGVKVIDPTAIYTKAGIDDSHVMLDSEVPSEFISSSAVISLLRSDVVLVHLGSSAATVGTSFEVGCAVALNKVLIVSVDKGFRSNIPAIWLRYVDFVCEGVYELRMALAVALGNNDIVTKYNSATDCLGSIREM
jgi:nucleoside 2-deoxyribosyltransferase